MSEPSRPAFWSGGKLWAAGIAAVVILIVAIEAYATRSVRGAVTVYFQLIAAANRQDLEAAKTFCSDRYQRSNTLELNREGGIKDLPRTIHMNYQAWQAGKDVWICPTKQSGPVYRFVKQGENWTYDGVVGLLREGRVVPMEDDEPSS